MTETIQVRLAAAADAPDMLRVSRTAFAARRPVDPPADALSDTLADMEHSLAEAPGACALDAVHFAGCPLVSRCGQVATPLPASIPPPVALRGSMTA